MFCQFIMEELCASLSEGREWDLQRQERLEFVELVVEAANEGDDKRPVLDGFADIG